MSPWFMMKSLKLRFLLFGAMLVAASWIGYWIGYVTTRTSMPTNESVQGYNLEQIRVHARPRLQQQPSPHLRSISAGSSQAAGTPAGNEGNHLEDDAIYPGRVRQNEKKPEQARNLDMMDVEIDVDWAFPHAKSQSPAEDKVAKDQLLEDMRKDTVPYTEKDKGRQHLDLEKVVDDHSILEKKNVGESVLNPHKLSESRDKLHPWMDMKPAGLPVPQGDAEEIRVQPSLQVHQQTDPQVLAWKERNKQNLQEDALSPVRKNPSSGVVHAAGELAEQRAGVDEHYTLIHAGAAARVHGKIHAHIKVMENVDPSSYIFTSNSLPSDPRMRPSIANGHVGTAIHRSMMFMNGLYSGRGSLSSRAAIPSTCSFNVTGTTPASEFARTYTLNVGEGIYSERSVCREYNMTQRIYAHRKLNRLIVAEVDLSRAFIGTPLSLNVKLNKWQASRDITFMSGASGMEEVSYKFGHINAPETYNSGATEVHILYDHIPDVLVAPMNSPRTKWVFITAVAPTEEEARKAYDQGRQLIQSHDQLYADHVLAWSELWQRGRIDVYANEQLSRVLHSTMYYLLSSLPLEEDKSWPFIGLSPSGLPFGDYSEDYWDYQGHVFWDQETWMFPPLLTMHSDLARILAKTRGRTMAAAAENAKLNHRQGYMYPWESAYTGVEVTPSEPIAKREIHITGDISLALQQYLDMTNDVTILQNENGELTNITYIITNIANYWVSRLVFNSTLNANTILDVIPPDEYVEHANNSVYTNAVAKVSLSLPQKAFRLLNKTMNRWQDFANKIYIPFDSVNKYHPEYDGYVKGTRIKQADAVMLGYPLNQAMLSEVRRNDLSNYEKVTAVGGPAMSWAMYTIGWLEMGEREKAGQLFRKNYHYVKNAFQVWTETTSGDGATNFLTGIGGFLQAVINGYGGIRIHGDGLFLNPIPPLDTKGLHLIGLDYQGRSLNIFAQEDEVMVVLTSEPADEHILKIYLENPEEILSLKLDQGVKYDPRPAVIKRVKT